MLSLAGIPFTAGFFGKLFVFIPAIQAGLFPLVVMGAIGVGAGLYYYLKLVRAVYWMPSTTVGNLKVSPVATIVIGILTALLLFIGINPEWLMSLSGF
jgi:NADH-quinone oxidoreductase subunit N